MGKSKSSKSRGSRSKSKGKKFRTSHGLDDIHNVKAANVSDKCRQGFKEGERERMLKEYLAHKPKTGKSEEELSSQQRQLSSSQARRLRSKQLHQTEEGDHFFYILAQNPRLHRVVTRLLLISRFLTLFGLLFFLVGIFALIFYRDKDALSYMGVISLLHVIGGPLGLISAKLRNRYLILIIAISNVIWLFFTFGLIFYCLWMIENKNVKEQFDQEILLHVGLFFYTPTSCLCGFYCYELLRHLHDMKGLSKVSDSTCEERSESGKGKNQRRSQILSTKSGLTPSKVILPTQSIDDLTRRSTGDISTSDTPIQKVSSCPK